jgi:phosphoglycolate phosphatase-like HAD superfamily hydrolase
MKSLVIFDLDGTLLNSIEDLGEAANYALKP